MKATYVKPMVTDYGTLVDLTEAVDFAGPEDAGLKSHLPPTPHHS